MSHTFAMNRGLGCKGDIIIFLNGGDRLTNNTVFSDISKSFQDKDISFVYGDKSYFSKKNKKKIVRKWKVGQIQRNKIKNGWNLPHLSTYIKKDIFFKIGKFNTNFEIAADFDFTLKLISNEKYKYKYLDKFIVEMEQGGMSNSGIRNLLKSNIECYKSLKNMNYNPSPFIILSKPFQKLKQLLV